LVAVGPTYIDLVRRPPGFVLDHNAFDGSGRAWLIVVELIGVNPDSYQPSRLDIITLVDRCVKQLGHRAAFRLWVPEILLFVGIAIDVWVKKESQEGFRSDRTYNAAPSGSLFRGT
jgi:hypothetical protein